MHLQLSKHTGVHIWRATSYCQAQKSQTACHHDPRSENSASTAPKSPLAAEFGPRYSTARAHDEQTFRPKSDQRSAFSRALTGKFPLFARF